jgi:FlaA1/EpsC-like NDP-sugar epimerase
MGATKRVGELIVQTLGEQGTTCFSTVRFGNVLGSNGSVVPRFVDQIKAGGPVTVTHPEIRRFFMLIPEAVHLVLHAATLGVPGATYVLDMGEPIRLVDLARNVIRLAGYIPEKEIAIRFVGLRPGEKLFEELVGAGETAEPSQFENIQRVRGSCHPDPRLLASHLLELGSIARNGDSTGVIQQLRRILPEFVPPGGDVEAALVAAAGISSRQSGFPNHLHGKVHEPQSRPLVPAAHGGAGAQASA